MSFFKHGLIISALLWISCYPVLFEKQNQVVSHDLSIQPPTDSVLSGRQLAAQYCSSCHLFPEPAMLDKKTWVNSVLPNMGFRLGINQTGKNLFEDLSKEEEKLVRELNIYPRTSAISKKDWKKIVKYYQQEAPEKPLPQKEKTQVTPELFLFTTHEIFLGDKTFPQTTLLKYDKSSSQLYIADARNILYVLGKDLRLKETLSVQGAATDIDFPTNAPPRVLTIGSLKPSELKTGSLISLQKTPENTDIQNLPRPVQFTPIDLTQDGKEDVIISGFGNHTGKLFWLDGFDVNKEHVLKAFPGARKVEISDFNQDGKPDIMALMAQAKEEISIFYNLGDGKFEEKTLLQFPPLFGAIYFELADFNKDGFQDIILTNGDNWDYSPIRKYYHGVRIYLNDGKNNFNETWFYPLYGASKAVARDFDKDGDIDIAATSFYTELDDAEQNFIYLSNEGNLDFKAFSTPQGSMGKWLTMEAADVDNDGDTDIILGSYFHNVSELTPLMFQGITTYPNIIILKNQSRR